MWLSGSLVDAQHLWLLIVDAAGQKAQSRSQKTTESAANKETKKGDLAEARNAQVPKGTADLEKVFVLSPFLDPDSARSAMNGRHAMYESGTMKRKSSHKNESPGKALSPPHLPFGIKLLSAFFAFGCLASTITVAALLFPQSALDSVWRLNQEAKTGFAQVGRPLGVVLMTSVATACCVAAFGLARGREWGRRLALGILVLNLVGDSASAFIRRDVRTLIGLPVGAVLIFYLVRTPIGGNPIRCQAQLGTAGGISTAPKQ